MAVPRNLTAFPYTFYSSTVQMDCIYITPSTSSDFQLLPLSSLPADDLVSHFTEKTEAVGRSHPHPTITRLQPTHGSHGPCLHSCVRTILRLSSRRLLTPQLKDVLPVVVSSLSHLISFSRSLDHSQRHSNMLRYLEQQPPMSHITLHRHLPFSFSLYSKIPSKSPHSCCLQFLLSRSH